MKKSLFTAPVIVGQLAAVAFLVQGCTTYTPGRTALGGPSTELPGGTVVRVDELPAGGTVTRVSPQYLPPTVKPTEPFTQFVIPEGTAVDDPRDGLKKTAIRHVPAPAPSAEIAELPATRSADGKYALYVVKRGDTTGEIANRHGLPRAEFVRINNLVNPDRILIGQKLKVPADGKPLAAGPAASVASTEEGVHVVASGETLGGIAVKYSMRATDLASLNNITNPNIVRIGQKLKVAKVVTSTKPRTETPAVTTPLRGSSATKSTPVESSDGLLLDGPAQLDIPEDSITDLLSLTGSSTVESTAPGALALTASAPAPAAPKATAQKEHTVREGEDIFGIAIDYGVRPMDIRRENNMTGSALTPGSVIKIPLSDSSK